ncbi:MAG: 1-(5-phosphoribosyl)-5-[(5-phosphoribosylamino)methylideneamino]imidazole-4-carboxamide isomerase [Acholeplasmatales bacterium]|nr:1-(5-phosphoribosyl)-5-[(5-phosphoribosylamino)methylideneamino]imidazole-4-carboxamide isomerase [Acholeplasmatales bacterium]
MRIYPAIDLHNGEAVRLYKGDYDLVTGYGDPVLSAKKFKEMGASFIHLVDLDGAKEGKSKNLEAVKRIIKEVDIDLELGGGIRTKEQIKNLLDLGLKRVILGSIALNLEFVKDAINTFGSDKIVIGIDCKNKKVATHGWLENTDIDYIEFALKLKEIGVKTIIFTDISKDGTLEGINLEQTKELVNKTNLDIVASGGAKSELDVKKAKEIGCEGIILGKSIYSNQINLSEIIKKYED